MVPRPTCINNLASQHLIIVGVLHLERVLCIWQHNDVGVLVEGSHQQQPELLADFGVPLLAFGKCPVNALLAGGQLPALLNEEWVHSGQGNFWNAKNPDMITHVWDAQCLLCQGGTEGEHHLGKLQFLAVILVRSFCVK